MDLGPNEPVRACPTCGVDAARAYIVSAVSAFYLPTYHCPRCGAALRSMQAAANHMATHESNVVDFVNRWVDEHHATSRVIIEDE